MAQQLHFNILTFDWPKESVPFNFHPEKPKEHTRLHRNVFPNAIDSIFPGLSASQNFIGCTYDGETEGFTPLLIDFKNENPDLIKQYYNRKIKYIFERKLEQIVKTNFIKEKQVWVSATSKSTDYKVYDRFTIKVQLATVSQLPELFISYDVQSKIWNKAVPDLIESVSPQAFKRVLYKNEIKRYDDLATIKELDYSKCFPVIGQDLRQTLKLPHETNTRVNRYSAYLNKAKNFIIPFLQNPEFNETFPLHSLEFLKVDPLPTNKTTENSNLLCLGKDQNGNNVLDCIPYNGISKFGPYERSPFNKVYLFFITHSEDVALAKKLNNYFGKNGFKNFSGLEGFALVLFHTESNFSIVFHIKENPFSEIEEILLNERTFNRDIQYLAIYITPFTKFDEDDKKRDIYYKVKEMLLKRGITSLCIDAHKDPKADYQFSMPNIAVAILAKLKGTPWRLNTAKKNELIVGIGAFKHIATDVQYIGSSFSFDNTGHFNNFEYFMKNEVDILAGSIIRSVCAYASVKNKPDKLVIHFYKTMSEKELKPIEEGLRNLGLDIPVFIVSINKTESEERR